MPPAARALWTKTSAGVFFVSPVVQKPPEATFGWLFHFRLCIKRYRNFAQVRCSFMCVCPLLVRCFRAFRQPLVAVIRRRLLRIAAIAAKARRAGLGRQFACYLDYPLCDMLPGCKF